MTNKWNFPLRGWEGEIPTGPHPGAFAAKRKYDHHTGVDLYVLGNESVYAVEDGIVVQVEDYTGPKAKSPWWLPTKSILIEGSSGVVCYGEVTPSNLAVRDRVERGQLVAHVMPVLQEGKRRTDIPGHSRFMLHFELYKPGTTKSTWWLSNQAMPQNLLDPTGFLLDSLDRRLNRS